MIAKKLRTNFKDFDLLKTSKLQGRTITAIKPVPKNIPKFPQAYTKDISPNTKAITETIAEEKYITLRLHHCLNGSVEYELFS